MVMNLLIIIAFLLNESLLYRRHYMRLRNHLVLWFIFSRWQ